MNIKQYVKGMGVSERKVAQILGISAQILNRYTNTKTKTLPRYNMLHHLFIISKGKLEPNSFVPLQEWKHELALANDTHESKGSNDH